MAYRAGTALLGPFSVLVCPAGRTGRCPARAGPPVLPRALFVPCSLSAASPILHQIASLMIPSDPILNHPREPWVPTRLFHAARGWRGPTSGLAPRARCPFPRSPGSSRCGFSLRRQAFLQCPRTPRRHPSLGSVRRPGVAEPPACPPCGSPRRSTRPGGLSSPSERSVHGC